MNMVRPVIKWSLLSLGALWLGVLLFGIVTNIKYLIGALLVVAFLSGLVVSLAGATERTRNLGAVVWVGLLYALLLSPLFYWLFR